MPKAFSISEVIATYFSKYDPEWRMVFDWMHDNFPTLTCWIKETSYNPVLKKKYKYAGHPEVKIVFEPIFV